ncbi:hypothetical protein BKP64_16575 [Marinobacter salinus]|uniref:diguanylate cyclase n=1 Tax=Marinobacter salinus TaxID=1874317 RepID=A0A1D9GPV5_9GAMM|nr:diguanylate cyclase [Marinobacter salinus]AOY89657.1 hypothetical protein BKP64_16575 [Marinobacter salinus]
MVEDKNSEVARKLELLKQRFKEKATADLVQLQAALKRVRSDTAFASGDIAAIYQSLHRLAGSAGTFGYGALGEEARRLELAIKPLAEACSGRSAAGIDRAEFDSMVGDSFGAGVMRLVEFLDQESNEAGPADLSLTPGIARRREEPLVLIADPDRSRAEELARDLGLHGFRTVVEASIETAVISRAEALSAIVARDWLMFGEGVRLQALDSDSAVICIGSEDSFSERYGLAERGVDGFLCEPVDVPLLADYIERLITEREEGGAGRVMIVDDDPELLEHYGLVLEGGGLDVRRVNDPATILGVLSEFRPDIVLMDMQMGRFSGINLARMLRFDPEWLGLPIIFLSSEEDREFQVEALSKGGDDFLTKPVSDAFLLRAVSVRCYRARQLDKLASRDSLTGLLKHSLAKAEIQKEHARCLRLKQNAVVAMLDLDHFKQVNDRYGHRAGDLVIKGLASLLRHRLRKSDIIGRYGGEEFVVALPDCPIENARAVLQSICDQVSQIAFNGAGQEFTVTLSVGLAPLDQYATSGDAIEAADQALYRRKQNGRNGVAASTDPSEKSGGRG